MRKQISLLLIGLVAFHAIVSAKKNENAPFFKSYTVNLALDLDVDQPFMVTKTSFEVFFPTELSTRMLPEYSIYLSDDDELRSVKLFQTNEKGKKQEIRNFRIKQSENNSGEYFVTGTKIYTIDFPDLRMGTSVIMEYVVSTEELHFFTPMYFNRILEAKKINYTLSIPSSMQVKLVKKNLENLVLQKNTEELGDYRVLTFSVRDREAIQMYEDGPDFSYYTPHILPILEKYKSPNGVVNFLSSPLDLYKYYSSIVYSKGDLISDELKAVASELKNKSTGEDELIKNTYNWVQNNIRYIAYEKGADGVIPRAPALVCKRKFGDCKDMSNLIKKLLEINGISAQLTWIGTRSIPYKYEEVYSMNVDNHMIASLNRAGKWLFLDATDPNGIYGLPTSHIQGKQAMIARDADKYDLVEVPIPKAEVNRLSYDVDLGLDGDDLLLHADVEGEGMVAGSIKNTVLYKETKEKEGFMKSILNINSNKAQILDYSLEMDASEKAKISGDYRISSRVRKIGNSYILNPYVNKVGPLSSVDMEDREVGMEILYNKVLENRIKVKIPDNYEIANLPESFEYSNPKFSYDLKVSEENGNVVFYEKYQINAPDLYLSKDEVVQYNDLVKKLKKIYNQSIKLNHK